MKAQLQFDIKDYKSKQDLIPSEMFSSDFQRLMQKFLLN